MKKNSASRHLPTGRSDSAYAAGVASASTSSTESTVAIAEFARNGPIPAENTCLYSLRVGEKSNFGLFVYAAASGLNDVITIHSTGKKKTIPANHASVAHATELSRARSPGPRRRRGRRRVAVAATVAITRGRGSDGGGGASGGAGALAVHQALAVLSSMKMENMTRSATLATISVPTTVTTPSAADCPTSKPRNARW